MSKLTLIRGARTGLKADKMSNNQQNNTERGDNKVKDDRTIKLIEGMRRTPTFANGDEVYGRNTALEVMKEKLELKNDPG